MSTQKDVKNINLLVKDEQDLYTPFSPEDEFNENVKQYIRSQAVGLDFHQQLQLTVISSSPLDEDKFRSAVANWIDQEKALFTLEEKNSTRLETAMFVVGALIIILVSLLKQYFEPLTYAIILIIGTAALGKGVTNWYEHVPGIKAKKWLINEFEKANMIVFEYK